MSTLRTEFLKHVGQTSPSPLLIEVESASGVFLYTPQGKRYFDLISGVSVCNVGHSNPEVVAAIKEQADSYLHTMVYGETVQRVQVELAKSLIEHLPQGLDSVYFVNSGAEAVEGPLLPDVRQIRFNNLDDLRHITSRTACVVSEVVQGEAGVVLPCVGYLEALQSRCKEVGALLVVDEIQTGLGRTGSMFACNKYSVTPDIVCLAKALGGGLPLGAFVARKEVMDSLQSDPVLGHITTFGGNPLCCAAGLASLRYIVEGGLDVEAERMGQLFEAELSGVAGVVEVRSSGLLMAVELGSSEKLYALMSSFVEVGIMSDWFLFCDTAFRISPPLTITEAEVREVCSLIRSALSRIL